MNPLLDFAESYFFGPLKIACENRRLFQMVVYMSRYYVLPTSLHRNSQICIINNIVSYTLSRGTPTVSRDFPLSRDNS